MKIAQAIKDIMKSKSMTQSGLAQTLGMKTQSVISERLNSAKTMSFDVAIEMLDVLGYDVVLKPKNGKGESYTITNEE